MKVRVATVIACDFCGKTQDQVKTLIKGPNDVAICDECVNVCIEVLCEQAAKQPTNTPPT